MIAIVAGTGSLPLIAAKSLLQQKKAFFVISLFPEENFQALHDAIGGNAEIISQKFYKLGSILQLLKEKKSTGLLMIGKVDKMNLLKKISFDWLTLKLLASLSTKSDSSIMETLISHAELEGLKVLAQDDVLQSLLVKPGALCGTLSDAIQTDIDLGMALAEKMSAADVGQTVIMKDKMVIALEAIEGTDACIQRGIELGSSDLVICKAAQPHQNKKYDLPTLGPATLHELKPGQVAAIAWQATQTFIVDQEAFVARAQELGIALVSV